MTLNLTEMSRQDLLQLQTDVGDALKSAEQRDRLEALKAAKQAAAEFGFSLEEISKDVRPADTRSKAAPKYRNPENPEDTWTGRGRKPHWIHTALTSGSDISELEI